MSPATRLRHEHRRHRSHHRPDVRRRLARWAEAWQQSWDAQQAGFLFDREQRFAALLDLVEVVAGPAPTVVDLACGTGVDHPPPAGPPARGAGGGGRRRPRPARHRPRVARRRRARAHRAGRPAATRPGSRRLGGVEADAVVTSTALHWLPEADLARAVPRPARRRLRPGGLVANADTMPADGLPRLGAAPSPTLAERREAAALAGGGRVLGRLVGACRRRSGAGRADGRAGGAVRRRRPSRRRSSPRRVGTSPHWRPPVSPRPAWPGARAPTPSWPPSADPRHPVAADPAGTGPPGGVRRSPPQPNWGWSSGVLPDDHPGSTRSPGQEAGGATASASRPAAGGDAPARPTR